MKGNTVCTQGGAGKEAGIQLEEPGRALEEDTPEAIFEGRLGNQGSEAVLTLPCLAGKLAYTCFSCSIEASHSSR